MGEKEDRQLKMFLIALEIEEKGRAFYETVANSSSHPLGKKIFKMLTADELVHKKRIKTLYQSLTKNHIWSEDWKELKVEQSAPEKIFKSLSKKQAKNLEFDASDLAALEVGIGLEFASISFYQERLNDAKEKGETEFLAQMIKEEKTHHSLLADMKLYLRDPSAWFIEKERHGLDGA